MASGHLRRHASHHYVGQCTIPGSCGKAETTGTQQLSFGDSAVVVAVGQTPRWATDSRRVRAGGRVLFVELSVGPVSAPVGFQGRPVGTPAPQGMAVSQRDAPCREPNVAHRVPTLRRDNARTSRGRRRAHKPLILKGRHVSRRAEGLFPYFAVSAFWLRRGSARPVLLWPSL